MPSWFFVKIFKGYLWSSCEDAENSRIVRLQMYLSPDKQYEPLATDYTSVSISSWCCANPCCANCSPVSFAPAGGGGTNGGSGRVGSAASVRRHPDHGGRRQGAAVPHGAPQYPARRQRDHRYVTAGDEGHEMKTGACTEWMMIIIFSLLPITTKQPGSFTVNGFKFVSRDVNHNDDVRFVHYSPDQAMLWSLWLFRNHKRVDLPVATHQPTASVAKNAQRKVLPVHA